MSSILNHIKHRYSTELSSGLSGIETVELAIECSDGGNTVKESMPSVTALTGTGSDQHNTNGISHTVPSAGDVPSSDMTLTCHGCGKTTRLILYEGDTSMTSPDTGAWYRYACVCGHSAYICERDYYRVLR